MRKGFSKEELLFIYLAIFFVSNALIAEFIGVKIFSLERSFKMDPMNLALMGVKNLNFDLTAGVLLWPLVFIITDVVNEYYGVKGVKLLSVIAAILIVYAFLVVSAAINLAPAEFWITDPKTKINMDLAYNKVFGQGLYILAGSISAFLIGQIADAYIFQFLKKKTGTKHKWLRATFSTLISQLIDTFVVLFIAFYIGAGYDIVWVLAVGLVSYSYKFIMAIILLPLLYLIHRIIGKYLGEKDVQQMADQAISY